MDGVRPKVGFTQEETDEILGAVNVQNKLHHCQFIDNGALLTRTSGSIPS